MSKSDDKSHDKWMVKKIEIDQKNNTLPDLKEEELQNGDYVSIVAKKRITIKTVHRTYEPDAFEVTYDNTYYRDLTPNKIVVGTVETFDDNDDNLQSPNFHNKDLSILSRNTRDGGKIFYTIPLTERKNFQIFDLTEFEKEYKPDIKTSDEICQLIKKYPVMYKSLHDIGSLLPKKYNDEEGTNKESTHYKCKNGMSYPATILKRLFGKISKGGNKKSRKIYKKKTKNRTKTKKKKSKTSRKARKIKN